MNWMGALHPYDYVAAGRGDLSQADSILAQAEH
jgi:hypothetical protein